MKMKTLQNFLLVSCFSVLFTSCNKVFYQVYTLDSKELQMHGNAMQYKNADCRVTYNFWSNGGIVAFAVENLTDKDIFVNMNESFLVVNGFAHNYFEDKTYTYGNASSAALGYGENLSVSISGKDFWGKKNYTATAGTALSIAAKSSTFNSVSQKEQEVICIPAHSFKVFSKFCLSPDLYVKCINNIDFPKTKCSVATFANDNSPLKMNNRITYGFNKGTMDKHIDNMFWLSDITNYSEKSAIEKTKEKGCYDDYEHEVKQFNIGSPSQFYKDYMRKW